jgi:hypothetical protein
MDLNQFSFPVEERSVAIQGDLNIDDWLDSKSVLDSPYKAIVRADTNEPIAIVKNSYKLVSNEQLIQSLLYQLASLNAPFYINPTHSFVENSRMRLMVTFPNLKVRDSVSDIALSLFVENSYDMSSGVRVYFGAIRSICSNGMIFGDILAKVYNRHTKNFSFESLQDKLDKAKGHFPEIQHRIRVLESLPVTKELVMSVSENISKRLAEKVIAEEEIRKISQWELFNRLTNHISHEMDQPLRAKYQENVSKVFRL